MSKEWQTDAFRGSLVRKLEEAIRESGVQNHKTGVEMEKQVFQRAKNKEEYLSYVAKLILHVKQQGRIQQNQQPDDMNQGMAMQGPSGAGMQQTRMMNSTNLQMQNSQLQMQPGMPVSQQQQMMMQQQLQIRARLQQQQQMQQQQSVGPRMSQLQQALQQRPQVPQVGTPVEMQQRPQRAQVRNDMRQPLNAGRGMPSSAFGMRPGSNMQIRQPTNQGPSPLPYNQSPQMKNPSPGGTIPPSPVGAQNRSNSLAPSPSSQVNTPLNPASQEDKEYLEKVKSLEKYIEPLRKMILKVGNEDNEKLDKMKKLLDIMSNPDKRMTLPTLQKCEDVLKRMQLDPADSADQQDTGLSSNPDKNPLIEAVLKLRQTGKGQNLNQNLNSTFLPPIEVMLGPEISLPPLPSTPPPMEDEEEGTVPDLLQGEVARLSPRFKVWLDSSQPRSAYATSVNIVCELDDQDLPAVPHLHVTIPRNYPSSPPECDTSGPDYLTTSFLQEISAALSSRLMKMPRVYTLSQLLSAWELSVRAASAPVQSQANRIFSL